MSVTALAERAKQLLQESNDAIAEIETRKRQIVEEREKRIDEIRAEYAERLATLDDEVKLARRLANAIEGPAPRKPRGTGKRSRSAPGRWQLAVLELASTAKEFRAGDVQDANPAMPGTTAYHAINYLREHEYIRMTRKGKHDGKSVRYFAITPAGRDYLKELADGNAET